MASVIRILLVILLLTVLTGAVSWLLLPYISASILTQALNSNALDLEKFVLRRPVDLNLHLDEIRIVEQAGTVTVDATGIVLRPASTSLGQLAIDVEDMIITVAGSDQESAIEMPALLGTYMSVLPMALDQGQIHRLELCLPSPTPCIIARLTWWHDGTGLQSRIEAGEYPHIQYLHLNLTDRSSSIEFFQPGEQSITADLQATWPDLSNLHLKGSVLSTDDRFLASALPELPDEVSMDLQALSAVFDLQLPLKTLQQASDLTEHISGDVNLKVSGNVKWEADEFSFESNQPIVTELKVSPDNLTISIAPDTLINTLIPGVIQGTAINQQQIVCHYHIGSNDLDCNSGNLTFTANYMSASITAELLVADFTMVLPDHNPMSANASIELAVREADESRANAKGHVTLRDDIIVLTSTSMVVEGLVFNQFELVHSLASNTGELQSSYKGNTSGLSRWIESPITGDFDVEQNIKWQGNFDSAWQNWPVTISSHLTGSNLEGEVDGYTFKGGELNLTLTGWSQLATPEPVRMKWQEIDVGFPMRHTELSFNLLLEPFAEVFHVRGISAETEVLGGKVSSDEYVYSSDTGNGYLMLTLDDLDLLEVLSLEQEEFYAEGKLHGRVPVNIEKDQIYIEDGAVAAIAPGGIIQYKPSEATKGLVESNAQMALVVDTLRNFRYDTLQSKVDFSTDGILHLSTSLTGSNPDLEGGRRVNFNLDIEENIAALLESLRLSEDITKRVEEKYNE